MATLHGPERPVSAHSMKSIMMISSMLGCSWTNFVIKVPGVNKTGLKDLRGGYGVVYG